MQLKVVDSAEVQGMCTWDKNRERFPESFEELKKFNPLVAEAKMHVVITFANPDVLNAINTTVTGVTNSLLAFLKPLAVFVDHGVNAVVNNKDNASNTQTDFEPREINNLTTYRYVGPVVQRPEGRELLVLYTNLNFPETFNGKVKELIANRIIDSFLYT